MEPIKDLDVCIAEAQRAVNMFGALSRLPRILEIIKSAQNLPKELEMDINRKKLELDEMEGRVEKVSNLITKEEAELDGLKDERHKLIEEIDARKQELMHQMETEVREAREDANAELKKIKENSEKTIREHRDNVKASEEKMLEKIQVHQKKIKAYQDDEEEARLAMEAAKEALDKVKKSFD